MEGAAGIVDRVEPSRAELVQARRNRETGAYFGKIVVDIEGRRAPSDGFAEIRVSPASQSSIQRGYLSGQLRGMTGVGHCFSRSMSQRPAGPGGAEVG